MTQDERKLLLLLAAAIGPTLPNWREIRALINEITKEVSRNAG